MFIDIIKNIYYILKKYNNVNIKNDDDIQYFLIYLYPI